MYRFQRHFGWGNQRRTDGPLSLWNDFLFVAVGSFNLAVSMFGLLVELGPRIIAGTHVDRTHLVSFALIGAIGLFFIVAACFRIDRTIHQVSEQLKPSSAPN